MKARPMVMLVALLSCASAVAESKGYPQANVSYDDFKQLVADVERHRAERLVGLDTFLKMSKRPDVVVLDTRSAFRFDRVHIRGARHLSFTDFTQENLREVIPSFDTTILIYCNNNFSGNQRDFATKVARPITIPGIATEPETVASQLASQERPLMMALNVPTYINLYGYGYRNVYELDELVDVNDPRIEFAGSIVDTELSAVR